METENYGVDKNWALRILANFWIESPIILSVRYDGTKLAAKIRQNKCTASLRFYVHAPQQTQLSEERTSEPYWQKSWDRVLWTLKIWCWWFLGAFSLQCKKFGFAKIGLLIENDFSGRIFSTWSTKKKSNFSDHQIICHQIHFNSIPDIPLLPSSFKFLFK